MPVIAQDAEILATLGVEGTVIRKGAEAVLIKTEWVGRPAIIKYRVPKGYRIPAIDRELRAARTGQEAKALIEAKRLGVPTPAVFEVNLQVGAITMAYVEGKRLKDILTQLDPTVVQAYFRQLGGYIARLHAAGHIHGDITTSNILVGLGGTLSLIDFGLHTASVATEDRAVDLHLFKRVVTSTHATHFDNCFPPFVEGYRREFGSGAEEVIAKITDIESRGRYVAKADRRSR
jgi:Kae1-associated kinase Bud32